MKDYKYEVINISQMENINEQYNIEFAGININAEKLLKIIDVSYEKTQIEYDIELNKKMFKFKIKKNSRKEYEVEYNNKIIHLEEKIIKFKIKDKTYSNAIYCYYNLLTLLNLLPPKQKNKNKYGKKRWKYIFF